MKSALADISPVLFLAFGSPWRVALVAVDLPRAAAGAVSRGRRLARAGSAGSSCSRGLLQTMGLRLTTRPEIGLPDRTDVRDGTFARCARL